MFSICLFFYQSVRRDVSGVWQTCSLALALCVCGVSLPGCCCWEITVYHSAHPNTTGGTELAKVSKNEFRAKNEARSHNQMCTEFRSHPRKATYDPLHYYAEQSYIKQQKTSNLLL